MSDLWIPLRARTFQTVRGRLAIVIALATLPVVLFTLATSIREYDLRKQARARDLLGNAALVSQEINRVFGTAEQLLKVAARQPAILGTEEPECALLMQAMVSGLPAFAAMGSFDGGGNLLCSTIAPERRVGADKAAWFRQLADGNGFVIEGPRRGSISGETILIAAARVTEPEAAPWALALSIRIDFLKLRLGSASLAPDTGLFIVDREGNQLISVVKRAAALPAAPEDVRALLSTTNHVVRATGEGGTTYTYAVVPLGESGTFAVLAKPALTITLPIIRELAIDVASPIVLSVVTLLLIWFAMEQMSNRWVRHLRAVVIAHRRGFTPVRARDYEAAPLEYRELAEALNTMADAIETREAKLTAALEEREALVREVHHRVKNNLQVIISLFNLQARYAGSDLERAQLREMQSRIEGLALVHHAAYQSEHLRLIPMREFLPALTAQLDRFIEHDSREASIRCRSDEVLFTIDEAVPMAQLIAELVNAICLHSKSPSGCKVEIDLAKLSPTLLRLTIEERSNTAEFDETAPRLKFTRILSSALVRQLGGTIEFPQGDLRRVQIDLPYRQPATRE